MKNIGASRPTEHALSTCERLSMSRLNNGFGPTPQPLVADFAARRSLKEFDLWLPT